MYPKAKKYLWQNFLKNPAILQQIVGDNCTWKHVLEIGPWPGDLTEKILEANPASLTLVELDSDMIPLLKARFPWKNITIYQWDVLNIDVIEQENKKSFSSPLTRGARGVSINIELPKNYDVYGNIPYYITSPIIMKFLYEVTHRPETLTFTMQKEVAERILAKDGKHTVLSLACQAVANIEKVCDISPGNFIPAPKVWSSCLRFHMTNSADINFLTCIKKWFAQKRKKLKNNLLQWGYSQEKLENIWTQLWLAETIRAEDVALKDWQEISRCLTQE